MRVMGRVLRSHGSSAHNLTYIPAAHSTTAIQQSNRDTFVDLFADGSLNIRGEVMLLDLLTQLSSTVDIGYRPQ